MSRVLIVDDNADNRYLLLALLQGVGHVIDVARDGAEALALARKAPPDLVVSDILMPGMDGFALCKEWRADSSLRSIPFMFYTATYTEPRDEAFALALGADRFVVKPQEPDALARIVLDLLATGRNEARAPSDEASGRQTLDSEVGFLREHRDALVRKLEDKMAQLEAANAALRQDIADRLCVEAGLRESEARYQFLAEVSPVGIFQTDPRGATTYVNKRWTEIAGVSAEDALGDGWLRAVHPDDRERLVADWRELLASAQGSRSEYRFLRPDGSVAWVIGQASVVRDLTGQIVGFVGTTTDITERALAEEARRRLAAVVEQAAEAVVVTDREGTIQYVNPAFERISGYSLGEVIGKNPRILKSGRHDATFYQELWATLLDRRMWSGEITNRRKDGSLYQEEANISPVVDENGVIVNYVSVNRDVTAEQALREQLMQAQKMEAVGRLASGIAHDFNNVLQAVLSQTAVLGLRLRGMAGVGRPLEELDQLIRRGAALTKQLLLFSRRAVPVREAADLNELVRGLATLLKRLVREDVAIVTELADTPLPVMADRGQCDQVIMNLVVNASDAMPQGGTLTMRTGGDGNTVWVSVTDTGHGISEDVRAHLFEPFFTTKPVGKGTGLGLSVVHGIVEAHGGSVAVSSREGAGTTFTVTLPRQVDQPASPGSWPEPVVTATGCGERVLLVEDEDGAREGLLEILGTLGYAVTAAASAEEAGALPMAPAFDLLLTDLVLPGIPGPDLANTMRERWPRLRIVVMSGYGEEDALRRIKPGIDAEFLQKPFDINTLARTLRRALEKDHAEAGE